MALVSVNENGGGDFLAIVKWDSRAGRMFRVDKDAAGSTPVDITRTFKALADFPNVEVGFILFSAGGAPDFRMVPYGQPLPAKPTPDHKAGVRLTIKLSKECGGDLRELAGTSNAFLRGINDIHDAYLAGASANPGKLPVIELVDSIAVESGSGARKSTNYRPQWAIAGWAPRPADMPGSAATTQAATSIGNAARNDEMVAPSPAKPTPAMATVGADDFG